jgi:hypothetical protein
MDVEKKPPEKRKADRAPNLAKQSSKKTAVGGQTYWALVGSPVRPLSNFELANRDLSVDVYHLNIETGDSAIYYLVQHPTREDEAKFPKANLKPFVHRAAIIDGGKEGGAKYIRNFLDKAPLLYDYYDKQGGRDPTEVLFPPFDSILITHWDSDHYAGILTLVSDGLIHFQLESANPDTTIETYLSPYFKYADAGTSTPASRRDERAETYIYLPYWGPRPYIAKSSKIYANKFPFNVINQNALVWYNEEKGKLDKVKDENNPKLVAALQGFLDWNSIEITLGEKRVDKVWALKLCRFRAGNEFILGANLFTNLLPSKPPLLSRDVCRNQMKNPMDLANAHQQLMGVMAGSPPTMPVLAIVAANRECCGDELLNLDPRITTLQSYYAPDFTVPPRATDNPQRFYYELNPERLDEAEEEVSEYLKSRELPYPAVAEIVAMRSTPMILEAASTGAVGSTSSSDSRQSESPSNARVKDTKPVPRESQGNVSNHALHPVLKIIDVDRMESAVSIRSNVISVVSMVIWTDGQISQLTAGDADWESEMRIVAWVSAGKNPFQSVRSIKLSHHGATSSTPTEMIRHFRPRNIVISCATRQFGHPRMLKALPPMNTFIQAYMFNRTRIAALACSVVSHNFSSAICPRAARQLWSKTRRHCRNDSLSLLPQKGRDSVERSARRCEKKAIEKHWLEIPQGMGFI